MPPFYPRHYPYYNRNYSFALPCMPFNNSYNLSTAQQTQQAGHKYQEAAAYDGRNAADFDLDPTDSVSQQPESPDNAAKNSHKQAPRQRENLVTNSSDYQRNAQQQRASNSAASEEVNSYAEMKAKCYPPRPRRRVHGCMSKTSWQNAKYVRDDCGSGIVPRIFNFRSNRENWCHTPLTSYQASHGELGRQILCGEQVIERTIETGPPCNICEYVLPLCRGYYRKYECDQAPCEMEYWSHKKKPRDKVERYWEPCLSSKEKSSNDPQSMALAAHLRKKAGKHACW